MTTNHLNSLWAKTSHNDTTWPVLDGTINADIVIVGGGFTGVSAAYHASATGASVVLIEARTIGFGGSGRNVGLVNAGLWTPPTDVETKIGKQAGESLNSALADGPAFVFELIEQNQIRCEAVQNGTLHCAHSQKGLRDLENRFSQQVARGAPVKLLDADETRKRTGSSAYCGALLDARAGTIQPLAYVQGLAQVAATQGTQIYENTCATKITEQNGAWLVETDLGCVRAARFIQATNAYGVGAAADNNIIPAHYFQLATAPLPNEIRHSILSGKEGCWDTALIMSSFRLDDAGRMIFGALGDLDGVASKAHDAWARRKLGILFPQLKGIPFEHAWAGRVAMTNNYLPRVERRGDTGVSIFGYSGRGISPGTLFGRGAAQWATGTGQFPIAISDRETDPFSRIKGLYYEAGATITHITNGRM